MIEQNTLDAAAPVAADGARSGSRVPRRAALGAVALTAIGAVLPWASVGDLSFRGTEGGGALNLVLVAVGALALVAGRRGAWPYVLNIVLAGLAGLIVAVNLSDVGRLASGFELVSVGAGLWVSAVGCVAWIAAALSALVGRRRARVSR